MKAIRIDIVFDFDIESDDEIDEMNKKLFGVFGFKSIIDWRDERTVEITTHQVDVSISAPRPWIGK